MKLLAIENSRLTALFKIARNAGQLFLPATLEAVSNRYSFAGVPSTLDDMTGDRIAFSHGLFQGAAIDSLDIYRDGIVISSMSDTDVLDEFFSDLCEWGMQVLGLSLIKTNSIDRIYESNILVEAEKNVLQPLESLSKIGKMVELNLKENSGLDVEYEPFGIILLPDQTKNPALKPVPFRLERRIGSEFSFNQFVATAPLKTKQHVRILEQFEAQF